MTISDEIAQAVDDPEYARSVRRIKEIAARSLKEADAAVTILATRHFNHTYLPDFVLKWPHDKRERFVFLRASAYAEELEEDVVRLADRHPVFLQLSEFQPLDDQPIRPAIDALDNSASASRSLVATMPAIGHLDDSPRTGRMLSSFVMRGGRGVIEDAEAESISQRVESGFDGAMTSDRAKTADALEVVGGVLDPGSIAEFTRLFEAAWISGGASASDFPGGRTTIGEHLSPDLLRQLLDIVPEEIEEFWEQIGNAVTLEAFSQLHLVGPQPRLRHIMRKAVSRLTASKYTLRRTVRADQEEDPFAWQVDRGYLSLRGGGYQGWLGASEPPRAPDDFEQDLAINASPPLAGLSARADTANVAVAEISVQGRDGIEVRFSSLGQLNVATSNLVERVTESVGDLVAVDEVVARVEGKGVTVDFERGLGTTGRTNTRVSVPGLIWSSWNLLVDTDEDMRTELEQALAISDASQEAPSEGEVEPPHHPIE
jgi:hypothetical protein